MPSDYVADLNSSTGSITLEALEREIGRETNINPIINPASAFHNAMNARLSSTPKPGCPGGILLTAFGTGVPARREEGFRSEQRRRSVHGRQCGRRARYPASMRWPVMSRAPR